VIKEVMPMEKTRPFYKRWYFWIAIVIWFIVLANLGKKNNVPAQVVSPEATEEVSVEAPQEPDTTEGKITAIIDSLNFKYSDLKIYVNGSSVKISLHYDKESWDETTFCSNCLTDYINLCSEAYQISGIERIEYYVFCDLVDNRGNATSQKGFAMCMLKEKYNAYTWKNMEFISGSYSQIEADSEYIDIHAGIKKNVDFEKMYYKG
jgi:hypothetical protein